MPDTSCQLNRGKLRMPRTTMVRGIVVASRTSTVRGTIVLLLAFVVASFALVSGSFAEGLSARQGSVSMADGAIVSQWSLVSVSSPGTVVTWTATAMKSKANPKLTSDIEMRLVQNIVHGPLHCQVVTSKSSTQVAAHRDQTSVTALVSGTGITDMQIVLKPQLDAESLSAGDYDLMLHITISPP
jgi:hypothetical protein